MVLPHTTFRLVLASSSPRRKQLLADAGYVFDVASPPMVEPRLLYEGLAATQQAESLAYFKAKSVAERNPNVWVLGADTVVASEDDCIFGKADDADEARRMLAQLSGTRHHVITGVAMLGPSRRRIICSDVTAVTMREMADAEIEEYVASGEWIGKAGAYAIQETADKFVTKIEGSWSNVVGLPMELLDSIVTMIREDAI